MKKIVYLAFVSVSFFFTACTDMTTPVTPTCDATKLPKSEHYQMGNPSSATKDEANPDNYLLERPQYVLSYNNSKGSANWVSWRVASEWIGSAQRQDDFRADDALPSSFYKATASSFTGSGFDRGHLCPSADRTSSTTDNSATFYMSNMIAQAPNVNQQNWGNMEDYIRKLVSQGNEIYVIAGGYGQGGTGSNGSVTKWLDNKKVTVPAHCWKIVVVLAKGSDDVCRVANDTRVIAVDIPNKQSLGTDPWGDYRVSVRELETFTGYDFLSNVPKAIQDVIEKNKDTGPTQ
jgi:endonuclease G, mitochondrial